MKIICIVLIVMLAMITWYPVESSDRLHHWVDSKGVTHLSKEPPLADGKLVEIMEYSVSKDKPAKTDQDEYEKKSQNRSRNEIVEKMQDTQKPPQPKTDLATACYILCELDDVHVYVIEFTDPDQVLERVLYRGNIPKGQKQLIESSIGKIKFSYRRSSDDRTYGDNRAECVNGRVISIP